jgi:CheY-like chemotaxis protein
MPDALERCRAVGCNAYVSKPIDGRLLELIAQYGQGHSAYAQLQHTDSI